MIEKQRSYDFHSMKPPLIIIIIIICPWAREHHRDPSTYRRSGVHHSQETRCTHKRQSEEEESRERKRFELTTHQKTNNTTGNTRTMKNDSDWLFVKTKKNVNVLLPGPSFTMWRQLLVLITVTGEWGPVNDSGHIQPGIKQEHFSQSSPVYSA